MRSGIKKDETNSVSSFLSYKSVCRIAYFYSKKEIVIHNNC